MSEIDVKAPALAETVMDAICALPGGGDLDWSGPGGYECMVGAMTPVLATGLRETREQALREAADAGWKASFDIGFGSDDADVVHDAIFSLTSKPKEAMMPKSNDEIVAEMADAFEHEQIHGRSRHNGISAAFAVCEKAIRERCAEEDKSALIAAARERDFLRTKVEHVESFCYRAANATGAAEFVYAETVSLRATIASQRELLDKAEAALDPWARACAVNDALPDSFRPSLDSGARDCLPGIWPTYADLRRARSVLSDLRKTKEPISPTNHSQGDQK